jgi:hypothetical protein
MFGAEEELATGEMFYPSIEEEFYPSSLYLSFSSSQVEEGWALLAVHKGFHSICVR